MKKVVIAKGEVSNYSSLTTDTLVVDGILKVNGLLRAKTIQGRGVVDANRLEAETVNMRVGFIKELDVKSAVFEKLYTTSCHVVGTLSVKDFVQALEVRARRLVINRTNIGCCTAEEIVSCKHRHTFRRAASALLKLFTSPFRRQGKAGTKQKPENTRFTVVPAVPQRSETPPQQPIDDSIVAAVLEALEEKGYTVLRPAALDVLPVEDAA